MNFPECTTDHSIPLLKVHHMQEQTQASMSLAHRHLALPPPQPPLTLPKSTASGSQAGNHLKISSTVPLGLCTCSAFY